MQGMSAEDHDPKKAGGVGIPGFIFNIVLLGFFSHYLMIDNTNQDNEVSCIYQDDHALYIKGDYTDNGDYTNVSKEFRMLNIFGIVWTALNCWAGISVIIKPCFKCAQAITACNCCGVLAWLITATVFRFRDDANGVHGCCTYPDSVT